VLPYQAPTEFSANGVRSLTDVYAHLRPGTEFTRTPTSVYLTPAGLAGSPLASLAAAYPPDAGLRLLTRPAPGTDGHLLLTAHVLRLHDLGPRVYDHARIRLGSGVTHALVVQHVEGRAPDDVEWDDALVRLRRLGEQALLRPHSAAGWDDPAFQLAGAHAAARVSADGWVTYDGVEHFALGDYEPFLERLAVATIGDTHLRGRPGRGERYLYQSVPGVRVPAKHRLEEPMGIVQELMTASRVAIRGRLVLDVGCNLGMAMAHYLHLGARWCHGWDLPVIVPLAERMLVAIGCTRFSTTAGRITTAQPVESDVPAFLQPALRGCVVSYLAIRSHVGWLDALARIPWAILIYEGHKSESDPVLEEHLAALAAHTPFTRGAVRQYREDRHSRPRPLTLLVRPEYL
jgi:hypothetical protein